MNRPTAVAGTWYPREPARLRALLEAQLHAADAAYASASTVAPQGSPATLRALIAPHAGLVYSGGIAAHAYRLLRDADPEAIVLVGPSHFVAFEGASVWPRGSFDTPLGALPVDEALADALMARTSAVHRRPDAHTREHSLEMQLPFLAHLAPGTPILPLVMGHQTRQTARALGAALAELMTSRSLLLVASSDLSHFHDASKARALDEHVLSAVQGFDSERLMTLLERRPEHACGGGPMVTVLTAAEAVGATEAEVLHYGHSGEVSGDHTSVVGYMAVAIW